MRFGVLGPVAVWTEDGGPVRIPELKVRALLAELLVHEGRVVPAARLIGDLWPDRLPRDPANALQLRVSQLRRALEAAELGGRELVVSQPPGYRLDAVTDVARFRSLVESSGADLQRALGGDRVGGEDDLRARARGLTEALGLWRGTPYADFAGEPFVRAAVDRLEEERLGAVESLAEIRLELGEHAELIGELGDQVVRNPLRQRLRAAYLKALYRTGRHSEALDSYRQLRERLKEELGLEPSAELMELQRAILRQDPRLDIRPTRRRSNLPAVVTSLIGREQVLPELVALLRTQRLVTLTGPGGVGKSRLAVEAARQVAGEFADGTWLVELAALEGTHSSVVPGDRDGSGGVGGSGRSSALGGPGRSRGADGPGGAVAGVVEAIATAMGIRDRQVVDALSNQSVLLVLDNCEHLVDRVAELAGELLRKAPGLRLLTTSQEPLAVNGERLMVIPPLDADAAAELFVLRASAAGGVVEECAAVTAICDRLDGLPLALELAATRVRSLGVAELSARLDDRFKVLQSGRRAGPPRHQTLRATVDWSWELLTAPEQIALRRLSVLADSCTLDAAAAVGAEAELVGRLVDRSLVSVVDGPRYRLLESIKLYAGERLLEAGEADEIQRRAISWYLSLAVEAEPKLYGHDQRDWLARLDVETPNLRAVLDTAVALGDAQSALHLVDALAWYWFLRGRIGEAERAFAAALSITASREAAGAGAVRAGAGAGGVRAGAGAGGVRAGAGAGGVRASELARTVAPAGAELGLADEGLRQRVVGWQAGIRLLGDDAPRGAAARTLLGADSRIRAHWFLGFAHRGGTVAATGEIVDKALAEYELVGDEWGIAAALSVRGTLGRARGELAEARRDAARSESIFRRLGDRWGQIKATNSLAELAEITGDYERATELHRDGVRMAEELGLWGEASLRLSGLGRIALLQGDFLAADEFHAKAMKLAAEQGNKPAEEFAELGLGLSGRRQGNLAAAEQHFRRWLDWLRQLDSQPGVPLVLAELGFIAEQRNDATAALALHTEGLAAAEAVGDPRALALAHEGLAGAHSITAHGAPDVPSLGPRLDPGHQAAHGALRAAWLLGRAAYLRESVGAPLPPGESADVDRITRRLVDRLGQSAFTTEYTRGHTS
ncbi:AfsR/SARP family transcriptional regulator [Kribbella qitaiheensis]|uniref:AfsR/SARP family transcriptional regulator n=1 Tax=Kribbella qitaiheensis TaxID=1544730 RepID=A0A7G6WVN7_9ACTN|nr:BTAD domain-containing putative transcriptional regulator [Kribbella qitaiheensis]QNE18052.1 AfsR/SARP family transcriptional regulator [Kribbella qitaiheensis]